MDILPLEILDFIEEIAEKYSLDKEFESGPEIEKLLSKAKDVGERQAIKFLYIGYNLPSAKLQEIIKDYLSNTIASSQIQKNIQERLEIEESIARQISDEIINNPLIRDPFGESTEGTIIKQPLVGKKTLIGQELE